MSKWLNYLRLSTDSMQSLPNYQRYFSKTKIKKILKFLWKWKLLSHVQLIETPWAIVYGILQTRILEWVAIPSPRDFPTQDWTQVSHTTDRFFTSWAMETHKTPNSQSSLEKEKQNRRNQAPWLQIILQSYSHQNNIVLAPKQKYRSIQQDRKHRNKHMHQ